MLRNAPDLISVHRVLLLGTASGFFYKLDNFFAAGTIVQWSPLFFFFAISISDHQMMDFKQKKSLQIGRADKQCLYYVWLRENMLCNTFLFLRQSFYQYFYMIREQKTQRSILWRSEFVKCFIILCSCDLRT